MVRLPEHINNKKTALPRLVILLFAVASMHTAWGQQFFVSPVSMQVASPDSLLQYTMIHIDAYGQYSAKARLQQGGFQSSQAYNVWISEADNSSSAQQDTLRYLFADSIEAPKAEAINWVRMRFAFQWINPSTLNTEGFYQLKNIDYWHPTEGWIPANSRIFSFSSTQMNVAVMQQFYTDAEIKRQQFPPATRGILPAAFRQSVMHLIIVANTADPSIGEAAKVDVKNVTETFSQIATNLGLRKPLIRTYAGTGFNKKKIETELRQFKVSRNDIIIFYYSGHGFRWANDDGKYPRIDFNTPDKSFDTTNSLRIAQVHDILRAKNARFTLVLSDCCNRSRPASNVKGPRSLSTRKVSFPFNFNNASRLFLPAQPTTVVATAAMPEELAGCNPTEGSYFTINFYLTLLYGVSTHPEYKNTNWNTLLAEVRRFTEMRGKTANLKQTVYWD